jgi:hypothetical protein
MKPQLILLASVPAVEDLGGEDGKRMVLCGGELVVLASDYEILHDENERLRREASEWQNQAALAAEKTLANIRENERLRKALKDLLDDMGEDLLQRHHRDKYRVYQISPQAVEAAQAIISS